MPHRGPAHGEVGGRVGDEELEERPGGRGAHGDAREEPRTDRADQRLGQQLIEGEGDGADEDEAGAQRHIGPEVVDPADEHHGKAGIADADGNEHVAAHRQPEEPGSEQDHEQRKVNRIIRSNWAEMY